MKHLHRAIIIFAFLAATCLILVGCVSKKKATNRYKKETQYEYENNSSEKVQNDLVKDSVSTRKTQTDWSDIIKTLNLKPVDPSKKSKVTVGEDENGNTKIEFENAEITSTEQQKQKKEIIQDSTGVNITDQGSKITDNNQTGSGQTLDKGRTSDSESTRWPTWIYFVIGAVLLVLIGGLVLEFKPDSLISALLKKIFGKK